MVAARGSQRLRKLVEVRAKTALDQRMGYFGSWYYQNSM